MPMVRRPRAAARLGHAIRWLVAIGAILPTAALTQLVIPVESAAPGIFSSRTTMTMLWEVPDADLTLVLLPGYPGRLGIRPGDVAVNNQTVRLMQDMLTFAGVRMNLVVFDSPDPLQGVGARAAGSHQVRLEEVVRFYRQRLGRPVWLMGHSDGSISVSEFLNRSEANRRAVAGAILSASRNETRISVDWAMPVLMIHHERDACDVTTYASAIRTHQSVARRNSGPTRFETVITGSASGPACSTGYHMYERAAGEVRHYIAEFIGRQIGKVVSGSGPAPAATSTGESDTNAEPDEELVRLN